MNVNVTFSIDPKLLERFDRWRVKNTFKTRSEALTYLMRDAMPEEGEPKKRDDDAPH